MPIYIFLLYYVDGRKFANEWVQTVHYYRTTCVADREEKNTKKK